MKRINFTEQELKFLKDFANEIKTQDNRGTALPLMFGVKYEQKVPAAIPDDSDCVDILFGGELQDIETLLEKLPESRLKVYDSEFVDFCNRLSRGDGTSNDKKILMVKLDLLIDELNEHDPGHQLVYSNIVKQVNPFNPDMFLTAKEANEFIERQRHNLGPNPFTYTYYMGCDTKLKRLLTIIEGVFSDV